MPADAQVQLITQGGALDALTPEAYREIYDEVRGYDAGQDAYAISLDKFVETWGAGGPTKAEWSRYHRGLRDLSREMKACLRRAVGLPSLPHTLDEAIARHVDPNARVYKVGGDEMAGRVILLAVEEALTLHANGSVSVETGQALQQAQAMEAPPAPRVQRCTPARAGVSMARPLFERANTLRLAHGLSWEALLELALGALEAEKAT